VKKKRFFFLFSGMMMFMSSCAPSFQVAIPRQAETFQELQALFVEREAGFQSIQGMVNLSINPDHGARQTITGILSFKQGGNLRFLGFDPLGRTIVDLTAVSGLFQISLAGEPPLKGSLNWDKDVRFRVGPGEKDLISVNSWVKTLNELRWGGTPLPGQDELLLVDKEGEALICSVIKVKGKEAVLKKRFWLERSFFRPVREEIYEESPSGNRLLAGSLFFENFKGENNGAWPGRMKAILEDGEFQVEFLETNFSPVFPPDYFQIQ
jgi:hypothetical protein